MAAIQVNVRYPELLLKRIDAVAEGNRSEWILEACRMRLDMAGDNSMRVGLGSQPEPAPKPDMQALRDICAGNFDASGHYKVYEHPGLPSPFENATYLDQSLAGIPICGKTWWEDGNHYECLMDKGHKELKHGLRGMVRIVD